MEYELTQIGGTQTCGLQATNLLDALVEAFESADPRWMAEPDFRRHFNNGELFCSVDGYADDAGEDDDPVESARISWEYDPFDGDEGRVYRLSAIRVHLPNDVELAVNPDEDFRSAIEAAESSER